METFSEVVVVPFSELLWNGENYGVHRGGPMWPDWAQQRSARHLRRAAPADELPKHSHPEKVLNQALFWAGPIAKHFGHMIADFGMRIIPTLQARPEAVFLTSSGTNAGVASEADIPEAYWAMMSWFGVTRDRVLFVDRPVLVRELSVAPQSEQVGWPGPTEQHLDAMDALVAERRPTSRSRTVYVSRAGMQARMAGEAYLENRLRDYGVCVLRPEAIPLGDQLSLYLAADQLIFAEGSAVHALQLLGRLDAPVHIIERRPGWNIARASIEPRTPVLTYHDAGRNLIHGRLPFGGPALHAALMIADEEQVLAAFDTAHVHLRPRWDSTQFQEACTADVIQWLERERWNRTPGNAEDVLASLADAGLAFLAPVFDDPIQQQPPSNVPTGGMQ